VPAAVVQRLPAAGGIDQVHGPLGTGRRRYPDERDAVLLVQRAYQVALVVGADQVEVRGTQAERVHAERDAVTGLPGARLDRRHVRAVGERERQLGHVHDRVDARAAEHEHVDGVHAESFRCMR
jgi:hypothetical protein